MELALGSGSLMASSSSKLFICKSSLFESKPGFPKRYSKLTNSINSQFRLFTMKTTKQISWDDVLEMSQLNVPVEDSSYLEAFFHKIKTCNWRYEKISEFFPFVIEGQIVGYVHQNFANHLKKFKDVFALAEGALLGSHAGTYVTLHPSLESQEDRTEAVGYVVKYLGDEGLIPGTQNELCPVTESYGTPPYFSIDHAAAPYFGVKSYEVHVNAYVEKHGEKFMWIGKKTKTKSIYPRILDHLVAGEMPHNITCQDNIMKKCEKQAGIPRSISNGVVPNGALSYVDIGGYSFTRKVLFCYDLKLHDEFFPYNHDGEVESYKLFPMNQLENIIHRTEFFNPSASVVITDFLFRHEFVKPEHLLKTLQLLKNFRCGDST